MWPVWAGRGEVWCSVQVWSPCCSPLLPHALFWPPTGITIADYQLPCFLYFSAVNATCVTSLILTHQSSYQLQVGDDTDGILGFLVPDIEKEVKRGKRLRCHLCNSTSATVGCAHVSCQKTFHLPCLLRSGGLSLFYGAFDSFCQEHRPSQQVPKVCWAPRGKGGSGRHSQCGVCLERVPLRPGGEISLWTPCCKAWFHRNCVARLASDLL